MILLKSVIHIHVNEEHSDWIYIMRTSLIMYFNNFGKHFFKNKCAIRINRFTILIDND